MRLPKLNINAPHDWKGDLDIGIKAMTRVVVFSIAVLAATIIFLSIYKTASHGSQPYDVYTVEDWQIAVRDPFIDTIILHEDIPVTKMPKRQVSIIKDFE